MQHKAAWLPSVCIDSDSADTAAYVVNCKTFVPQQDYSNAPTHQSLPRCIRNLTGATYMYNKRCREKPPQNMQHAQHLPMHVLAANL
jgi:hypothetical protein